MIEWLRKRPLPVRILVYVLIVVLAFALAAGVGAIGTLIVQGDLSSPGSEAPQPPDEQGNAPRPQEKDAAAKQDEASSQQGEAEYIARVGDIQSSAVEKVLDSDHKLSRYDALTADDVEQMRANEEALQVLTEQVDGLDPPRGHDEQYEAFASAIGKLHRACELAYSLASDPTAATQSGFEEYDRHVEEAAAGLKRSNQILGEDYKTIGDAQKVNPLS